MAGHHITKALDTITYASIVRIAFVIAALNDLEVKSGDILNAYVQSMLQRRCGPNWVMSLIKTPERLQ